ncbi:MAG: hypothetical protein QOC95_34 [Thermoleophilaceae bacterium]|nr:hypothetical protein [Thermoleophilaceae bacterium]
MRATTVRFETELWALVDAAAKNQGVSAAQFIRDATVTRTALDAERRRDPSAKAALAALADVRRRRRQGNETGYDPGATLADPHRLAILRQANLLDSAPDPTFDRYTHLAAKMLNAPTALVSLVDQDRQLFKSRLGLAEPWNTEGQTGLGHSFCQHTVVARAPLVVSDSREHPLVSDNLAIEDLGVIAYAGAPLITSEGHALGALCVIDSQPRHWTAEQVEMLEHLAAAVVTEIELRAATRT